MKKNFVIMPFCMMFFLLACTPRENVSRDGYPEMESNTITTNTYLVNVNGYEYNDFTINRNGIITGYTGQAVDIVIPSEIAGITIVGIGENAFVGTLFCEEFGAPIFQRDILLGSVIIPNTVISIGDGAFAENRLTNVILPNTLISIGVNAFGHNQLTSVAIPESVTIIGDSAFAGNQLTSVTISGSVTSIGTAAFWSNQLTSIVIPDSVISIGDGAFAVNLLESITIGNNVELERIPFPFTFERSFDNNFDDFYIANGKRAGTYVFSNAQWSIR